MATASRFSLESSITESHAAKKKKGWKTTFRETIIPYLPPPVTKAIHRFDLSFASTVGPEASVTVGSAALIGWVVWVLLVIKGRRLIFGNGKAIVDHDSDGRGSIEVATSFDNNKRCKAAVILCGPTSAGKTRMFYQLCYGRKYSDLPTVMSLKPNVSVGVDRYKDNNTFIDESSEDLIQYVDWPGKSSVHDPSFINLLTNPQQSIPSRIILVLDSTQAIVPAAEILFQLLYLLKQRQGDSYYTKSSLVTIFIACHKKDILKAKNHKRIKIQMRAALEKLLAVQAKVEKAQQAGTQQQDQQVSSWWPMSKPLDFDELTFCKLHFASTTCCSDKGLSEIIEYCSTGSALSTS